MPRGTSKQQKISIAYAGRDDWKITKAVSKNPMIIPKIVEKSRQAGRINYELVVDLKENASVGDLRSQLVLVTDDSQSPQIPVLIEGKVEAEITVNPETISFGLLTTGQKKTVNIVLRGRKPFKIEKIESESGDSCYQVRLPDSSRNVHVLPLSIKTPKKTGKFNEEFTITIKDLKEPIQVKAYGEITSATASKKNSASF